MPKTSSAVLASGRGATRTYASCLSAMESKTIYRALDLVKKVMTANPVQFTNPRAVRDYLQLDLAFEEREVFACLWLDAQHRLIDAERMFFGTLMETSVYPREVVKAALRHNAAAVIFAHNHPSGAFEPSGADISLTTILKNSLALVDVRVLDHFIVGGAGMPLSLAETQIRPFGDRCCVKSDAEAAPLKKRRTSKKGTTTKASGAAKPRVAKGAGDGQ